MMLQKQIHNSLPERPLFPNGLSYFYKIKKALQFCDRLEKVFIIWYTVWAFMHKILLKTAEINNGRRWLVVLLVSAKTSVIKKECYIMKKHSFFFKVLTLILCAAVYVSVFYIPINNTASAHEDNLRGVWVATVANIDYPTKQTTDPEKLKAGMVEILDNCEEMGFNAIFFQVRPASDAFYKSDIFPWSRYLTGKQGVAPDGEFDPLEFTVSEAHKRGIEVHAWINPYRITNSSADNSRLSSDNPAILHPELVVQDSNGKMYYNPGEQDSRDLIIKGAVEIVENYDVDGLHMDDYFYPEGGFNDDTTYSYYKDEYPDKGNWRRAMVNELVKQMDEAVHAVNPDIQFGISPRGIWANASDVPGGSNTRGGGSYTAIYADSKAWVDNGWVDYIMPQIYWNIGYEIADYAVLADWWSNVVKDTDVKLYIGEGAYRTVSSTSSAWSGETGTNELRRHVEIGRNNPNISGYCMYTYNSFINNPSIFNLMKEVNAGYDSPAIEKPEPEVQPEPEDQTEPVTEPEQEKEDIPLASDQKTEISEGEYVNKFEDMGSYWWAMPDIDALASRGIIKGRSETQFDPDSFITRADNTVLLLRVLGKNAKFTENFDDVYADKYYYNEIGVAKELGIASGYGNNLFDPEGYIKRQDMATLAYRVLKNEKILTSMPNVAVLNEFDDSNDIDFYASDAMAACVGAGLLRGDKEGGGGNLNPQGYATRVQVALFMNRVRILIEEKTAEGIDTIIE